MTSVSTASQVPTAWGRIMRELTMKRGNLSGVGKKATRPLLMVKEKNVRAKRHVLRRAGVHVVRGTYAKMPKAGSSLILPATKECFLGYQKRPQVAKKRKAAVLGGKRNRNVW